MAEHSERAVEAHTFVLPSSYNDNRTGRGSPSSTTSSNDTTPSQTPTHETSSSPLVLEAPSSTSAAASAQIASTLTAADQTRGRPRYKRRQPSRRYFTPPSRMPSPVRHEMPLDAPPLILDFQLEVESAPQDPDIFADAETDYFSSTDRNDGEFFLFSPFRSASAPDSASSRSGGDDFTFVLPTTIPRYFLDFE